MLPLVAASAAAQAPASGMQGSPAGPVTARMCPGSQPVRSVLITNTSSLAVSANWEARQGVCHRPGEPVPSPPSQSWTHWCSPNQTWCCLTPRRGAGWPQSFSRALAALCLILACSGDGGDWWEQMVPVLWGGQTSQSAASAGGRSPQTPPGLAGPLPGAGKLLCFSGWWEDGELQRWGERVLPT